MEDFHEMLPLRKLRNRGVFGQVNVESDEPLNDARFQTLHVSLDLFFLNVPARLSSVKGLRVSFLISPDFASQLLDAIRDRAKSLDSIQVMGCDRGYVSSLVSSGWSLQELRLIYFAFPGPDQITPSEMMKVTSAHKGHLQRFTLVFAEDESFGRLDNQKERLTTLAGSALQGLIGSETLTAMMIVGTQGSSHGGMGKVTYS